MKIDGNSIRPGMVIEHQAHLWRAIKIQHTQPGKGGAYLQVELREIQNGSKLNERFRSSEKVERVRLDQKEYQFLFEDSGLFTFMDSKTFEQISVGKDLISDTQAKFLQDGMIVIIESYEGKLIGVRLPDSVILEVLSADAVVKGQTASSSYKPAIVENGIRVMVPPYVTSGTRIVVNTSDASYIERAKDH
jgi:elongation factor P